MSDLLYAMPIDGPIKGGWRPEDERVIERAFGGEGLPTEEDLRTVGEHLYEAYFQQLLRFEEFPPIECVTFEYAPLSARGGRASRRQIEISRPYVQNHGTTELPSIMAHEMIHLVEHNHGEGFRELLFALQGLGCQVYRYTAERATPKTRRSDKIKARKKKAEGARFALDCYDCGLVDFLKQRSKRVRRAATAGQGGYCTRCNMVLDLYVKNAQEKWVKVAAGYDTLYVDEPQKWVEQPGELPGPSDYTFGTDELLYP